MTITLKKPESAEYYNFSKEVKQLAKKDFGDFHYGEVSCVPVSRFKTSLWLLGILVQRFREKMSNKFC